MARDPRLVAHKLAPHGRLHAVGTDQRNAAVLAALGIEHGHASVVLLDALHPGRGGHLDAAGGLRAFEQRAVHVSTVDHRAGVAKALAKRRAGGNAADQGFIQRVVHHHLVGVDGAGARNLANAQRIKRGKAVRPELDARTNFAELRCLLKHLDRKATPHQRQRRRDAATSHQNREPRLSRIHWLAFGRCMQTLSILTISIVITSGTSISG